MALLPLPKRRCLAAVGDDGDGATGNSIDDRCDGTTNVNTNNGECDEHQEKRKWRKTTVKKVRHFKIHISQGSVFRQSLPTYYIIVPLKFDNAYFVEMLSKEYVPETSRGDVPRIAVRRPARSY